MAILKSTRDVASVDEPGKVSLATIAEAVAGLDSTKVMTPAATKAVIDALIDGAPGALDTLNELAAAIADDANFAVTTTNSINNLQSQINTLSGTNLGNLTTEIDAIEAGAGLNTDGTFTAPSGTNYLGSASTLKGADVLLDAQIKQNADDIAALGNGNLSALQSEVDDIEASVGLATDGSLGTWANTNNYSASATFKEAIEGVDAQVATNTAAISSLGSNAAISALQSELDASQAGVGLSTTGAYVSRSGTNYIDSASSIVGEIGLLDSQIKSNEDDIALKASSSDLTALTSRVTTNESDISTLQSDVSGKASSTDLSTLQSEVDATQAGVGLASDGSYSAISGANYATSSSTLKAAVGQLDTQLKSTQDDLDTLETTVGNLQTGAPNQAEVDAIEAGVGLSTAGAYVSRGSSNYLSSATSIATEIGFLDSQIKTNENAISANDTDITSINSTLANKADSSSLASTNSTIDTIEASVGLTTSGGFTANSSGNYISSATTVRGEINALDSQVSTNAGDISNLSSTVSTLTAGGGANASQITALQSELDQTQTGAGLGTTGAYSANSGSNYIGSASSLKDADDKLDAQIKTNADAIALRATTSSLNALQTQANTSTSDITSLESDMSTAQSDITANASAISSNDSDISALQTNQAAIEGGVGLNSDGSYSALTGNYNTASTLKGAVSSLDTQVKTNADAIALRATTSTVSALDTRVGDNESDISTLQSDVAAKASSSTVSALQSELDTTQASAGLNANGSLPAFQNSGGANLPIIGGGSPATSLKDALHMIANYVGQETLTSSNDLSEEVVLHGTEIDTLNTLANTHESSIGLEADGSYNAITSATYASSSSSLKAAVAQLDTQLASTQSDLDTAEAAIVSNDTDIATNVSAINTIEASVGLSASGAYQAPGSSNYLGSASSVRDADSKLDAQIKTNADAIASNDTDIASNLSAIQSNDTDIATNVSAINTVEASVGLSTAGAYISRSGSNYLDSATSIANEATLLDAQVSTNATAIATKASSSSLSTLQTEVDAIETAVGLSSSGAFVSHSGTNYIDSASSIKGSLELLDTAVKARETAITSEISNRTSADSTLQSAIDTVEASVGLTASGGLSISGTNFLDSSSTIVAALDTLDTNQKLLSDIRLNMISAIGLSSTGVKNNYANTNYISNSEDLIESVEALDRQIASNASSISSLGSGNIANLQSELDDTQSGAGLGTDGSYSANSSTNYLTSVSSLKAADEALDTQIKTNADAIATKANSTTLSALDLRVTQLEQGGGGIWSDDSSNDEVFYEFKVENMKSHLGPFEIVLGGANGYIRALVASASATTDLIMYDTVGERDGDRHFSVHPTTGDVIFEGKYSS